MKDVSARTYCMNYSTTDSEKLVLHLLTSLLSNRCQQVQVPYKGLIQDENKTDKRTCNGQ